METLQKSKHWLSKLTRPIAFLDIEGTGLDISKDRIITLCVTTVYPNGTSGTNNWKVNPGIPIPPESTEIHGIKDEDVAGYHGFDSVAEEVMSILSGCDLGGYNLRNYDVPLLYEEFSRVGIDWNLEGIRIIDAGAIFKFKEPRDLSAAVLKYCGREMTDAHDASADVTATIDVLFGQLAVYPDLADMDLEKLAAFSKGDDKRLDLAGKLALDADGDACFMIGNPRGRKVKNDVSFAYWMLGKDFSSNTKSVLRGILDDLAGKVPIEDCGV